MTVDVSVGRLDLIRFNISTVFKVRANWVMFFLLWAFVLIVVLFESEQPLVELNYPVLVPGTLVVAAVAFAFFFLFMMLFTLLALGKNSHWIGPRTYSIEDDGLREITESSSLIQNWNSIQDIFVSGRMMMVRLDAYQFFLMPERGFNDPSKYEEFCAMVQERWKAAA